MHADSRRLCLYCTTQWHRLTDHGGYIPLSSSTRRAEPFCQRGRPGLVPSTPPRRRRGSPELPSANCAVREQTVELPTYSPAWEDMRSLAHVFDPEKLLRIAGLICGSGVSAVWTSFLALQVFRARRRAALPTVAALSLLISSALAAIATLPLFLRKRRPRSKRFPLDS
jgi:hypothetical protein